MGLTKPLIAKIHDTLKWLLKSHSAIDKFVCQWGSAISWNAVRYCTRWA